GGAKVQGLTLVAHKGKLYRVGGMQPRNKPGENADNVSLADCAWYDPAARKWHHMPALPRARAAHGSVAVVGPLFVGRGARGGAPGRARRPPGTRPRWCWTWRRTGRSGRASGRRSSAAP